MKTKYKLSCAAAALLAGLGYAGGTFAADAADSASTRATGVEEIVVTAQRRTENLQNVPLTVQAFTGGTLSNLNVTTSTICSNTRPTSRSAATARAQGAIFMRGLSTGFAGNQSVGDDRLFPQRRALSRRPVDAVPARNADIYVADLERVEVLEGPQGTLFGGGAEAGAVRYITNKPI